MQAKPKRKGRDSGNRKEQNMDGIVFLKEQVAMIRNVLDKAKFLNVDLGISSSMDR